VNIKRGYGHIIDDSPDDSPSTRAHFGAFVFLPARADLTPYVARVRDQLGSSSCVGQATAAAIDVRLRRLGAFRSEASALALYALARLYDKPASEPLVDEGTAARTLFRAVRDFGVPPERVWPFDADYAERVLEPLPMDVLQAGGAASLPAWYRIDSVGRTRVDEMRHALSRGYPVIFAIRVDQAFEDATGKKPIGAFDGEELGRHMLACVGYETDANGTRFRILNSWGDQWADGGFVWFDEARILDPGTCDLYVVQVAP
jgi:C1A family cysteine protease